MVEDALNRAITAERNLFEKLDVAENVLYVAEEKAEKEKNQRQRADKMLEETIKDRDKHKKREKKLMMKKKELEEEVKAKD